LALSLHQDQNVITMKFYAIILLLSLPTILLAQYKIYLSNGQVIKASTYEERDSVVVFRTKLDGESKSIFLKKSSIVKVDKYDVLKNVKVYTKSGKSFKAKLLRVTDDEIVLVEVNRIKIDTLVVPKFKLLKYEEVTPNDHTPIFDIGFLKGGGSIIGMDVEIPIGIGAGVYFGAGYKGFGSGINFYFERDPNKTHKGYGLSTGYIHQGWGDSFAGSMVGASLFYKMRKGISLDLGLSRLISIGNFNYYGKEYVITYSAGLRF
jgi:hypothetical protein